MAGVDTDPPPDDAERLGRDAAAALDAGQAGRAERLYTRALAVRPGRTDWLMGRSTARRFLARHEDALADVAAALEGEPDDPRLRLEYAHVLRETDRPGAVAAYRAVLDRWPGHPEALVNLGHLARLEGRHEEALDYLEQARAVRPGDDGVRAALGIARLAAHDPAGAIRDLEAAVALNPWNRNTLAHLYAAYVAAGRPEAARRIFDGDTMVAVSDELFDEATAASLLPVIRGHDTLSWERAGNTTRGGAHTGNLLDDPDPLIASMAERIDASLGRYLAALPHRPEHPFLAWRPEAWRLEMWSVVLASGGYQAPHIHPDGWVSGVCYLAVPREIESSGSAGWLEVGRPPDEYARAAASPLRRVRPARGRVVLFPSFAWHRTLPFESADERICLAFDLRPIV